MIVKRLGIYARGAGAKVFSICAQFLLIYVISNYISFDALGFYGPLLSFCVLAGIVVNFGQSARAYIHVPPIFKNSGRDAALLASKRVFSLSLRYILFGFPIIASMAAVYFRDWKVGLMAACVASAFAALETLSAISRSIGRVAFAEIMRNGLWRVCFVAVCYLLASTIVLDTSVRLTFTLALSMLITLVIMLFMLGLSPSLQAKNIENQRGVNTQNWAIQCVQGFTQNIDILLVPWLFGLDGAATYFIAVRLASIVAMPLTVTNPIITPIYSQIAKNCSTPQLSARIRMNTFINFSSSIVLVFVIVIFGDWLAYLLSGKETDIWWVLIIISVGQIANASVGPSMQVSQLFDIRKATIFLQILGVVILIAFAWCSAIYDNIYLFAAGVAVAKVIVNGGIAVLMQVFAKTNLFTGTQAT